MIEVTTALLICVRRWFPVMAAAGSTMAAVMILITLSLLFTTLNQDPGSVGFLMKDIFLLGTAVWSLGDPLAGGKRW